MENDQLSFLVDFSNKINLLENIDEICLLICKSTKDLIAEGYVAVALFDNEKNVATIKATEGFYDTKLINKGIKLLKKDPRSIKFNLKNIREEDLKIYRSGELRLVNGGLYIVTSRKFPKTICRIVEKLLNINFVYTIGFSYLGHDVGAVFIFVD